jgi:hypothetical protein
MSVLADRVGMLALMLLDNGALRGTAKAASLAIAPAAP